MMLLLHVVGDEFKEGDHPRDNSGKFSETSGGGGSSKPQNASATTGAQAGTSASSGPTYVPSKQLTQVFKKHGWQPVASSDKPTFYSAKHNLKVVVHPPKTGSGIGSQFSAHGAVTGQQMAKGYGFKQLDYLLKNIADVAVSGSKTEQPQAQPNVAPPAATASSKEESTTPGAPKQEMAAFGYKEDHGTENEVVYVKPNGAAVKIKADGDWVASTPGHLTKEGSGLESLQQLLSGKTPSAPPWKNSSQAVQTKEQKHQQAAQPEAQKQEAAKKAQVAETAAKLTAQQPPADKDERAAIDHYTNGGYTSINKGLRQGLGAASSKTVKALDDWLAKSEVKEDLKVYRKVSGEYANVLKSVMFPGAKFIDRGFVSTSINNGWSGDLYFEINVPKGAKGAYVDNMSSHPGEKEFLLPRDSKFVVKNHDISSNIIELELDIS
jgi:hypothetical protein